MESRSMTKPTVPTVRQRAMHVAFAAMLAASMGATSAAAPVRAWAEDGSITIAAKDNQAATYKVYELFKADIAPAEAGAPANIDGIATHLQWAIRDAPYGRVVAFLIDEGMTAADARNPQKAAEFIGQKIAAGPWDADAATVPQTPAAQSFADRLAKELVSSGAAAQGYAAGSAFTAEEGYYLFVTDDASVGAGEAGTAAVWVPLGGKTAEVVEKTATATIDKQVRENSSGDYVHAGDAHRAQEVDYLLSATVPDNIGAYAEFYMKFTDTLSEGLDIKDNNTSSVVVKVGGTDVTGQLARGAITYSEKSLVVDIADVLALDGVEVAKGTKVTVEYKASLNGGSAMGQAGNENDFELVYTDNPVTLGKGVIRTAPPRLYTYQLDLEKLDKATGEALKGAKITIKSEATGKYVQADGSLADAAHEFETGSSGKITVPRIDSGTFTLHETAAPAKYETWDADIVLTITPTFNQTTGALTDLKATASGGEAVKVNEGDVVTHVRAVDPASGAVSLTASDDKMIDLPITGLSGTLGITALAGGAVVLGLAGLIAVRRKEPSAPAGEGEE